MIYRLINADVMDGLRSLPDEKIQCCITSPPYFGLRDYGSPPSVWGGDAEHGHEWGAAAMRRDTRGIKGSTLNSPDSKGVNVRVDINTGSFCSCGAWRGCLGLEPTPELYVEHMVTVFRETRRVLHDDGLLFLNIGDSYAGSGKGGNPEAGKQSTNKGSQTIGVLYGTGKTARDAAVTNVTRSTFPASGIKAKDLIGIPWMLGFALRADGWYLRSEIIWAKPNGMPGSQEDRCTSSHETIFMLSKNARYFSDFDAVKTPPRESSLIRTAQDVQSQSGSHRGNGGAKTNGPMKAVGVVDKQRGHSRQHAGFNERWDSMSKDEQQSMPAMMRDVWFVPPASFDGAHFAVMPEEIARRCILAGSRFDDTILDPFCGSGTVGGVALANQRNFCGIDRNPDYITMSRQRCAQVAPMFTSEEATG